MKYPNSWKLDGSLLLWGEKLISWVTSGTKEINSFAHPETLNKLESVETTDYARKLCTNTKEPIQVYIKGWLVV